MNSCRLTLFTVPCVQCPKRSIGKGKMRSVFPSTNGVKFSTADQKLFITKCVHKAFFPNGTQIPSYRCTGWSLRQAQGVIGAF